MVSVLTRTNDDSLLDIYDRDQPPMCTRGAIRKILRNVWNVTEPRDFQIRVIYCGASHKGPDPPHIGLIRITGEVKYIVIIGIDMLRHGIKLFLEPLILISSDQVTSVTELSNPRSCVYEFHLDALGRDYTM